MSWVFCFDIAEVSIGDSGGEVAVGEGIDVNEFERVRAASGIEILDTDDDPDDGVGEYGASL